MPCIPSIQIPSIKQKCNLKYRYTTSIKINDTRILRRHHYEDENGGIHIRYEYVY